MDLSLVKRVEEVTTVSDANRFLALGWVILSLYTTEYDPAPPRCFHQTQHYVLGWMGDAPQYPKDPDFPF